MIALSAAMSLIFQYISKLAEERSFKSHKEYKLQLLKYYLNVIVSICKATIYHKTYHVHYNSNVSITASIFCFGSWRKDFVFDIIFTLEFKQSTVMFLFNLEAQNTFKILVNK